MNGSLEDKARQIRGIGCLAELDEYEEYAIARPGGRTADENVEILIRRNQLGGKK